MILLVLMHRVLCSRRCRQEMAAFVVIYGSGMHFLGFHCLHAPRAVFPTIAGRPSSFRLVTWSRSWHRATDHGGKRAFPPWVQLLDKVLVLAVAQRQIPWF